MIYVQLLLLYDEEPWLIYSRLISLHNQIPMLLSHQSKQFVGRGRVCPASCLSPLGHPYGKLLLKMS